MLFSQLHLERIAFEIRYEHGYLYWDRSGHVLRDMIGKFPKFEVKSVELGGTQALWPDEAIAFTFANDKFHITQNEVESITLFKEAAAHLSSVIFGHLNVKTFNRVGVRFIYVYPTTTKKDADELLATSRLFSTDLKEAEPFGRVADREIMLNMQREERGYMIRLSAAHREVLRSGITKPLSLGTEKFQADVVVFDVDSFTTKSGDISILSVPDFIRTATKTVEDNLLPLVGITDASDKRTKR